MSEMSRVVYNKLMKWIRRCVMNKSNEERGIYEWMK